MSTHLLHSSRISDALAEIMGLILFALTLLCTLDIALNLSAAESNNLLSLKMLYICANLLLVVMLAFVHSYLSERVTSDLLGIGEIFYSSAWYKFPVIHQRLMALPIERAQCEIRLKNLDLFDCSLAVFSSVFLTFFFEQFY